MMFFLYNLARVYFSASCFWPVPHKNGNNKYKHFSLHDHKVWSVLHISSLKYDPRSVVNIPSDLSPYWETVSTRSTNSGRILICKFIIENELINQLYPNSSLCLFALLCDIYVNWIICLLSVSCLRFILFCIFSLLVFLKTTSSNIFHQVQLFCSLSINFPQISFSAILKSRFILALILEIISFFSVISD